MSNRTLIACGALVALAGMAQAAGTLHVGLEGGVNIASVEANNLIEGASTGSRAGVLLGAYARRQIAPIISVGAGIRLDQRGQTVDFDAGALPGITQTKIRYSYLTIPIHARFDLSRGSVVPFLEVGPEVGFLLSAKASAEGPDAPDSDDDMKRFLDDLDLGIGFGGGIEIPAGSLRLGLGAGYSLGILNILQDESYDVVARAEHHGEGAHREIHEKNRAFRISLRVGS